MLERVAFSLEVLREQVSERFLSGDCNQDVLSGGELGLEKFLQRSRIRLSEDIGSALGMQPVDFHSQLCEGSNVVGLCLPDLEIAMLASHHGLQSTNIDASDSRFIRWNAMRPAIMMAR